MSPTRPADTDADALILIAHGSPDPDWRRPLEALLANVSAAAPLRFVQLCYLSDEDGLARAAAAAAAAGFSRAEVVAAFLSPGGRHIKKDLPALVAELQARFPGMELSLRPGALGDDDRVIAAMGSAILNPRLPPGG